MNEDERDGRGKTRSSLTSQVGRGHPRRQPVTVCYGYVRDYHLEKDRCKEDKTIIFTISCEFVISAK